MLRSRRATSRATNACGTAGASTTSIRPWQFEKEGEKVEFDPRGRLIVNEAQNAVTAAINGVGIAYLPAALVAPAVIEKRLTVLLGAWCTSFSGLYIYYPSRRQIPPPLQAFIDFAKKSFAKASPMIREFDKIAGVPQRKRPR